MKYRVTIPYPVFVTVDVDTNDRESAIDQALDEGSLTQYAGNGGHDKLVGVDGSNVSIEAGEMPIESGGFSIEVEEVS